jgi:hypothetical protein
VDVRKQTLRNAFSALIPFNLECDQIRIGLVMAIQAGDLIRLMRIDMTILAFHSFTFMDFIDLFDLPFNARMAWMTYGAVLIPYIRFGMTDKTGFLHVRHEFPVSGMGDILMAGDALVTCPYLSGEFHMADMIHFHGFYGVLSILTRVNFFKDMASLPEAYHGQRRLNMLEAQNMNNKGKKAIDLRLEEIQEAGLGMAVHTASP